MKSNDVPCQSGWRRKRRRSSRFLNALSSALFVKSATLLAGGLSRDVLAAKYYSPCHTSFVQVYTRGWYHQDIPRHRKGITNAGRQHRAKRPATNFASKEGILGSWSGKCPGTSQKARWHQLSTADQRLWSARTGYDLGREGKTLDVREGRDRRDDDDPKRREAVNLEVEATGSGASASSLDRMANWLSADNTKKLGAWAVFLMVVSRLRSFYGVMLGTFVLSYMGNSVIGSLMDRGNRALGRMRDRSGWTGLPRQLPRRAYASAYMLLLLTGLTSLSVLIVPRLTVESQLLISKLSEQDNPYAIIAEWMRNNFGEEALSRLEPFLLSVTGDQGRIFAGYPDNYLDLIASKLKNNAAWSEERYARFAKLLRFCLSRYFKGGLNMCRQVVAGLTKVLYKAMVSLLFSFMVIWDLPNLRRGVKALKTSRLGFGYRTIAPEVATFARLVGQSFEVQFTIAAINTLLTTGGLIVLGVSGPLVLSFIVFVCSFVPVIGVFLSTLPMVVAALSDYGMSKVIQIIVMVLGVHAVEAYLLNPQIYASKLKLHPVVVIGVLYMAEHLVGVQGLIIAVPCAVFVINNLILGNSNGDSTDKTDIGVVA